MTEIKSKPSQNGAIIGIAHIAVMILVAIFNTALFVFLSKIETNFFNVSSTSSNTSSFIFSVNVLIYNAIIRAVFPIRLLFEDLINSYLWLELLLYFWSIHHLHWVFSIPLY